MKMKGRESSNTSRKKKGRCTKKTWKIKFALLFQHQMNSMEESEKSKKNDRHREALDSWMKWKSTFMTEWKARVCKEMEKKHLGRLFWAEIKSRTWTFSLILSYLLHTPFVKENWWHHQNFQTQTNVISMLWEYESMFFILKPC